MFNKEKAAKISDRDLKDVIYNSMEKFCIEPHLDGYDYITYILFNSIRNGTQPHDDITKEIYPNTAKAFGVRAENIERCLRNAFQNSKFKEIFMNRNENCTNSKCLAVLYRIILITFDIDLNFTAFENINYNQNFFISTKEKAANISDRKLMDAIYNIIDESVLPYELKGYDYISHLLFISIREGFTPHKNIKKFSYPLIAKAFNTEVSRVERNIFHCINKGDEKISKYSTTEAIAIFYRKLLVIFDID